MGLTLTVDGISAAVGDLVEVNPGDRGRCWPRSSPSAATGSPACRWAPCPACTPAPRCGPPACRCRCRSARRCSAASSTASAGPVDGGPPLGSRVSYVDLASETPHALSPHPRRAAADLRRPRAGHPRPLRQGPAPRHLRRLRRRQVQPAGADHPRHRRRRPRHRPDRRAWPRGPRVPRGEPRPRGHGPHRRRRRHLRRAAAGPAQGRVRRHPHRRGLPRPGPRRAAAHGLDHPHRHGPARGRAVGRRAAGHPRLPAERLRDDAAAAGEGRHRRRPARSPASTPSWSRATTTTSRSPTPPGRSSTGTSCSPASWRRSATSRPSTSSSRSPASRRAVVPPQQMADAREVRRLMGALRDVKELIEIGAYQPGSDPLVDRARAARAGDRGLPAAADG